MLRRVIKKLISNFQKPESRTDDCARAFDEAAATNVTSSGALGRNRVAIIKPSCDLFFLPSPPPDAVSEEQAALARNMLPPEPRRRVTVIADTEVSGSLAEINKIIPFIGILTGMAYIGHCVIIFDGQLSRIEQGCRNSDLLIVDGAILPHLHHDWYSTARRAMRRAEIYVHDRKTYKLLPVLPSPHTPKAE